MQLVSFYAMHLMYDTSRFNKYLRRSTCILLKHMNLSKFFSASLARNIELKYSHVIIRSIKMDLGVIEL